MVDLVPLSKQKNIASIAEQVRFQIEAASSSQGAKADTALQPGQAATTAQGAKADTAVQPEVLSAVATSGNYDDLAGRPSLATVATSGVYGDLTSKPAFATVATSGAYADLTGAPTYSTVATSGAYADLTGKPNLGTAAAANTTAFATAAQGAKADTALQPGQAATTAQGAKADTALQPGQAATTAQGAKADTALQPGQAATTAQGAKADTAVQPGALSTVATSGAYADLSGKPTLATVATSGAYGDLSGRPSLSAVSTSGQYADLLGKPNLGTAAAANTTAFATAAQGAKADTAVQPGADITVLTETTTEKIMTAAERTKLAGIEAGATVNDTDANLKSRANHTGSQAISTIVNLATTLNAKADLAGSTFTGAVTLSGAPTADLHAATKKYVDDGLSPKAPLASPAFTGSPSFAGNPVLGQSIGVNGRDSANASRRLIFLDHTVDEVMPGNPGLTLRLLGSGTRPLYGAGSNTLALTSDVNAKADIVNPVFTSGASVATTLSFPTLTGSTGLTIATQDGTQRGVLLRAANTNALGVGAVTMALDIRSSARPTVNASETMAYSSDLTGSTYISYGSVINLAGVTPFTGTLIASSIPANCFKVEIVFNRIRLTPGTAANWGFRLRNGGTVQSTGYDNGHAKVQPSGVTSVSTASSWFPTVEHDDSNQYFTGKATFTLEPATAPSQRWYMEATGYQIAAAGLASMRFSGGNITLTTALDGIQFWGASGTPAITSGTMRAIYHSYK